MPLAVISKPAPGSGATLSPVWLRRFVCGVAPGVDTLPSSDEETEKRLTAHLRSPEHIVVFDNVTVPIGHPSLARMLTSSTFQSRELGKSQNLLLANDKVWIANGNNVRLRPDFGRRSFVVRIDPHTARPRAAG